MFANDNDQWSNSALSLAKNEYNIGRGSEAFTPMSGGDGPKTSIIGLRRNNKLPPLEDEDGGISVGGGNIDY